MNRLTLSRFGRQLTKYLGDAISLLGPTIRLCPLCGKSAKPFSSELASLKSGQRAALSPSFYKLICRACLSSIPWIQQVQCRICGRGVFCPDCIRRSDTAFVCNRSAVQYSKEMREVLARYKYRGNETLEPYMGQMLMSPLTGMTLELTGRLGIYTGSRDFLAQRNFDRREFSVWDAITYVPVSTERAEERGFNQAERLAGIVSRQAQIPLMHLLERNRHSAKQSFKTRSARMQDMESLFAVKPVVVEKLLLANPRKENQHTLRLLLVDDIYTTGSTIQACSEALQKASPTRIDIYALTWARS